MEELITKLKERQGDRGQVEFAAEIGITQAMLSRLYRGERQLGLEVAQKIARRFPDLRADVIRFLLPDDMPDSHTQCLKISA